MSASVTDQTLLARFRAGDEHAYAQLHERHRAALLRHARRTLGRDRAAAEDVVQEAFLRAHAALADPDREIAVAPWLHRIVRNACIDHLRRPAPALLADAGEHARAGEDAHAVAARREELRELVAGIAALPPRQRDALVGHVLLGVPHAAVAGPAGTSAGARKSLVRRARAHLLAARAEGVAAAA